jgi:hypothetical protein
VWDPRTFTKNRDRLLEGDIAQAFFAAVLERIRRKKLLSDEHFTIDGTLLEAWASHKSFRPKDGGEKAPPDDDPGNPTVDFKGENWTNQTHRSRVLWVAEGRSRQSLDGFWETLSAEQLAGVEAVAMDMWDPYVASTREHLEGAAGKIVYDKFHVAAHLSKAVD